MNIQQIIDKSQNIFPNGLEQINDTLYKAKYQITDKTAGIYFLNFEKEITEDYFEELQYKHLAEEFYNQEETLQWNIYLLFVNSKISDDLKIKILKDDKYARKLVFTDAEFIDYFKLEKSVKTELPNILSEWKDELNKVGLQELYSTASIEGIVRNFLNDTANAPKKRVDKPLGHIPNINKVNSISLKESYRRYPQEIRDFNFGSVNLFTGSNGVGKTSVLESIELILTGDTQRNKGKSEISNSITAVLNDSISDEYIHNTKKYKERGIKWYNRRENEQGNQTYKSFNQFNFFNTDAAQQFSNANEWDTINESLKEIVLGEEYTTLKAKIGKVYDRLKSELKKTSEVLDYKKNNVQINNKRINELKIDKNFDELKENIKYNISNLKYRNPIDESNYSFANLFINELNNELEFILNNTSFINYNAFIEFKEQFKTRVSLITVRKKIYNDNKNKFNKFISDRLKNENILVKGNRLLKYIKIDSSNNIEEVELNNENYKVLLQIINTLKDLTDLQFDIYNLKEEKKTLSAIIQEKKDSLKIKQELYISLKIEIETLQSSFNQNQKLINQLRNLGKEILNHNSHNNNCPLCEQEISKDLLLSKLENEFSNDQVKRLINEKNEKISNLLKEINAFETEIKNLIHYDAVIANSFKEYDNLSIESINKTIAKTLTKEKELLSQKEKNDSIMSQINLIEGSISEYSNLKSELSLIYEGKEISNKQILEEIITNLINEIASSYIISAKIKSENIDIIEYLNNELKLKDHEDNIDRIEEIVKSDETLIETINFSFDKIKQYIKIPNDEKIIDISKELSLLKENLNTLTQLENSQNEIKKLLSTNSEIEISVPLDETLKNRLSKAVRVLNKLSGNIEDSILQEFFDTNLNEIKDIFKTIHSPQEFTDIKFINKKLVLFKDDDDTTYEISQISTGQRGALVLSIFISLNRKLQDGPQILIFDDPVTFIDDFNALSFLDFLRYFIVKENKQIFFATANKKFASLFKKKFDFLGEDEFKEFKLER
ncbi:AAA family ATPase [Flavobacterium ardleyense]|uniref:AAA family ATPase n=1 Tax=Flavobacterium ardleyense TaxID=2038737 RepID=A0ABW5Z5G0_9FLAO